MYSMHNIDNSKDDQWLWYMTIERIVLRIDIVENCNIFSNYLSFITLKSFML